jgi:uncharacterized membrane protein HdeD (DUF308 family)
MTIGSGHLSIAVGVILKWAVTARVSGLNLRNMGVILMMVGVIGFVIGLYVLFRPRWPTRARPGPNSR